MVSPFCLPQPGVQVPAFNVMYTVWEQQQFPFLCIFYYISKAHGLGVLLPEGLTLEPLLGWACHYRQRAYVPEHCLVHNLTGMSGL